MRLPVGFGGGPIEEGILSNLNEVELIELFFLIENWLIYKSREAVKSSDSIDGNDGERIQMGEVSVIYLLEPFPNLRLNF